MRHKDKVVITVSKLLIRVAIEDAAMYAAREELRRQIVEQIKGTRLEGDNIVVTEFPCFIEEMHLEEIAGTPDLTFNWVD